MPFSLEVVESIIDTIPENDTGTIKACSLVCRSFRPRSQFRLLTAVSLMPSSVQVSKLVEDRCNEFFEISKGSEAMKTIIRQLKIPHFVSLEHLPFTQLEALHLCSWNGPRGRRPIVQAVGNLHNSRPHHVIISLQKNPDLRALTVEAFRMDDQFLLRVFDAIGALKEEPSKLQSLAFDSCQFETVLPTSSPYDVKFSSLHLRLGVNESIETLIHAFKIHGLHGFTATNLSFFRGADTYALATLLNRSRQELQFISLARLDPPSTYDKWGALRNVHFSEMICLTDFFLSQSGSSSSILSHIIEEVTRATAVRPQNFAIRIDYIVGSLHDRLLVNLLQAKQDSLQTLYFVSEAREEVLRMALPQTFNNDMVPVVVVNQRL